MTSMVVACLSIANGWRDKDTGSNSMLVDFNPQLDKDTYLEIKSMGRFTES
jgi:hypothetical protein